MWDAASGRAVAVLAGHADVLTDLHYSPDGTILATASADGTVRLWRAQVGQPVATLTGTCQMLGTSCISPDGQYLAAGQLDGSAAIVAAETGARTSHLQFPDRAAAPLNFSPDSRRLATADRQGALAIWDVPQGRPQATLPGDGFRVLTGHFSADGHRFIAGAENGTVRIWDVERRKQLSAGPVPRRGTVLYYTAFLRDGRNLVAANAVGNTIWVLEPESLRAMTSFQNLPLNLQDNCFSPDGRRILTLPGDQIAHVFSIDTGQELARSERHEDELSSVAFDSLGSRFVTTSADRIARIWDATNGQLLVWLVGHLQGVDHAAFDEPGLRVVTASRDGTVRTWEAATGRPLAIFPSAQGLRSRAYFNRDGRRLIVFTEPPPRPSYARRRNDAPGLPGTITLWDVAAETRSPQELDKRIRCRVPYEMDGFVLKPGKPAQPCHD